MAALAERDLPGSLALFPAGQEAVGGRPGGLWAGRRGGGLPVFLTRKVGLRERRDLLKVTQGSVARLGQILTLPVDQG